MTIRKNDEIELKIDGYTAEGGGVGHIDGFAVFVPGGAKGDTVRCHIIKAKKTYAVAKLLQVLTPAPTRTESDCPYFPRCGGCAFRHIDYEEEKRLKKQRVEDCLSRIGHIDRTVETVTGGCRTRYRNKAQYPVRRENGQLKIGFYAGRSHRVIDCPDCLLEPEEFARINRVFRAFLEEFRLSTYNEETGDGLVRHICMRKAFATGQIMVTVVVNGGSLPHSDEWIRRLTSLPFPVTSVYLNIQREKTNVILSDKCVLLYGEPAIEDILCGVRVQIGPLSFYQVNRENAEKLYRKAAELMEPTGSITVLDLYCGTGTIGLSIADKIGRLIGVEIVPEAVESARRNAAANGITNAEFLCADAEQAAKELRARGIRPDAIIIDPPRRGCGETLPQTLTELSPQKLIYISCDPATLSRDSARLQTLGWEIQNIHAIDMFPGTSHIETVCLLSKA